jgi:hypothetical protein
MLALHSGTAGTGQFQVLIVMFAILVAIFWRTAIKILLTVGAILFVILITSGAVAFMEGMHHLIR